MTSGKDHSKTKAQLIEELDRLRQQLEELSQKLPPIAATGINPSPASAPLTTHVSLEQVQPELEALSRLAATLDALPDLMFELDHDGTILDYRTPNPESLYLPPQEFLGHRLNEVLPPSAVETIMRAMAEAEKNGRHDGVEYFLEMSGETRWYELSIARKDIPDSVPRFITLIRDITERRRNEDRIRMQAMVLDQIKDLVTVTDLEGRIIDVNEAVCRVLQMSREQLVGQHVSIYGQDDSVPQDAIVRHTMEQGEWHGLVVNVAADGGLIFLDCRTQLVTDESGKPVAMCGISTDVSENRRAETDLRQLSEVLAERVKELDCLYHLSEIIERPDITLDEILLGAVEIIPGGYQYPADARARILVNGNEYRSADFELTGLRQWSDIFVNGDKKGIVEVCYVGVKPDQNEGPFLLEERKMINAIAERLGRAVERLAAREERDYALLRNETLLTISQLTSVSARELIDFTVGGIVRDTQSGLGFIGLIDEAEQSMELQAWSVEAMQECRIEEKPLHFPLCQAGVWGEAVRLRHSIVLSDYAHEHPARRGTPEGHVKIENFAGIPLFDGGRIVAVAGLANKKGSYKPIDIKHVEVLIGNMWKLIQKKQSDFRILESESKFRSIFSQAPISFELYDSTGKLIDANQSCLELFGIDDLGEVSQFNLFDDPNVTAEVKEKLKAGETVHYQAPFDFDKVKEQNLYRTRGSGQLFLDILISPVSLPRSGQPCYFVFIQNITDRKRAEMELRESQSILARAEEVARIGSWKWDIVRRQGHWSDGMYRIYGIERQPEMIDFGGVVRRRIHPDDLSMAENGNRRALIELLADPLEYRIILDDGTVRWVHVEGKIEQDEAGNPVALSGYVQDLTERKQAEEALRESERRFRELVSAAPNAVLVVQKGMIVYCNPEGIKTLGFTLEEELIGTEIMSYVHPDFREMVVARMKNAVEGKVTSLAEMRILRRDGEEVVMESASVAFEFDHQPATLIVGRDISYRKQIEDERLKAARLESIGVLAGGIAHDFNNILMGITGNITLAKMEVNAGENPAGSLLDAEKAADRARDLTRQLLTFSRGGKPIVGLESIKDIIMEAVGFVRHGANVKCDLALASNLLPAQVDAGQISQVIHNLVINAIQAMPDGGTVLIAAENILMESANPLELPTGQYIMISIADRGHGIPPEVLPRIFDPYFTTKETGSGLGLASAYSIINRHQGRITVESEAGKGSVFRVYLRADTTAAQHKSKPQVIIRSGGGRVLLMDDEPEVRRVARRMLERLGYSVEEAENGQVAIEKYQAAMVADKFSLVIFDLTIPGGLGGRETIQQIRKLDPHVKAIVASGYSEDTVMANYRDFGFAGMVAKPYKMEELGAVVQSVLLEN